MRRFVSDNLAWKLKEVAGRYSMSACNFPFGLGGRVCACLCQFLFQAVCLGTPAKDECA